MNFKNNLHTYPLDPSIRYCNIDTGYERGGGAVRRGGVKQRLRNVLGKH